MESSEDGGPIDGNLVGKLKMKNICVYIYIQ